jgi:hypothetical protein
VISNNPDINLDITQDDIHWILIMGDIQANIPAGYLPNIGSK